MALITLRISVKGYQQAMYDSSVVYVQLLEARRGRFFIKQWLTRNFFIEINFSNAGKLLCWRCSNKHEYAPAEKLLELLDRFFCFSYRELSFPTEKRAHSIFWMYSLEIFRFIPFPSLDSFSDWYGMHFPWTAGENNIFILLPQKDSEPWKSYNNPCIIRIWPFNSLSFWKNSSL